jgi:CheY-like chemotaxis protein
MHRPTILVVDDNPAIRGLYASVLTGAGYEVHAADSVEAMDRLASRRVSPAVIVTDVSMPVIDGMALARWLRSRPWLANVPVVAVTGQFGEQHRSAAMEAGCAAFLQKPVPNATLVHTVRKCLAG